MAFDEIIRPTDWLDYIMPRSGRSTGLQGAHLLAERGMLFAGETASSGNIVQSDGRFVFLRRLGFDANHFMNGSFNPETQRGGYVLGTAVHNGSQVAAFDDLQYDKDDPDSPMA